MNKRGCSLAGKAMKLIDGSLIASIGYSAREIIYDISYKIGQKPPVLGPNI
jgi:hypothetical protein